MAGARQFGGTQTPELPRNTLMQDLEGVLPGIGGVLQSGLGNTSDLLSGVESPAVTQTMNAYWGGGSGLAPGSEFLRNRAVDLYGMRSAGRKQQGMQDLLGLLGGISGPTAAYRGQDIQAALGQGNLDLGRSELSQRGSQFNQTLGENRRQFDLQHGLNQADQALRSTLGIGNMNNQTLQSYLSFLS